MSIEEFYDIYDPDRLQYALYIDDYGYMTTERIIGAGVSTSGIVFVYINNFVTRLPIAEIIEVI